MAIITRWRAPPEAHRIVRQRAGRSGAPTARQPARGIDQGAERPVQAQRFGDLPAHGEHRVQRAHRLLEDHRNAVAARTGSSTCSWPGGGRSGQVHGRRICTAVTLAKGGSRPRMAARLSDLPQPLSPTRASIRRGRGATKGRRPDRRHGQHPAEHRRRPRPSRRAVTLIAVPLFHPLEVDILMAQWPHTVQPNSAGCVRR